MYYEVDIDVQDFIENAMTYEEEEIFATIASSLDIEFILENLNKVFEYLKDNESDEYRAWVHALDMFNKKMKEYNNE